MKTAKELKQFQRRMRSRPTASERAFELRLKATGLDFKRQMICGFYILDFVVPSRMVYFEIDGASHDRQKHYDAVRDSFLTSMGFMAVRIRNEDVTGYDINDVAARPIFREWVFRRALSRAMVERGRAMRGLPVHFRSLSQQSLFDDPNAAVKHG